MFRTVRTYADAIRCRYWYGSVIRRTLLQFRASPSVMDGEDTATRPRRRATRLQKFSSYYLEEPFNAYSLRQIWTTGWVLARGAQQRRSTKFRNPSFSPHRTT